jgi:hypothetical protein
MQLAGKNLKGVRIFNKIVFVVPGDFSDNPVGSEDVVTSVRYDLAYTDVGGSSLLY